MKTETGNRPGLVIHSDVRGSVYTAVKRNAMFLTWYVREIPFLSKMVDKIGTGV